MNKNSIKSISLILSTLCIGMLLGALITGKIIRGKVNTIQEFTHQKGFNHQMNKLITDIDDQSRINIQPILLKSGLDIEHVFSSSRKDIQVIMDNMIIDLQKHLPEEKLQKLVEKREQIRDQIGPANS